MERILQDLRYGARLLRKQPAFSAVAIVTLALGLGATTAIFSVIDATMLRPLPYPDPEQLVTIYTVKADKPESRYMPSVVRMTAWRDELPHLFSHLATWKNETVVGLEGAEPERLGVMRINADYLPLYGIAPIAGRAFSEPDMQLDASPVVLLGNAYWRRQFNSDAGVVGRQITFAGESASIVGVLPEIPGTSTPIWRPLQLSEGAASAGQFRVFGRLRAGMTIDQAQRDMSAHAARVEPGTSVALQSMTTYSTTGYWTTLRILLAAVLCVLLIACVNVAGLQLARGETRQHELAVRAAIGAGRSRLFAQLLTESVLLSTAGGVLGVFMAWLSLEWLVASIPLTLRSETPVQLDLRVLGFGIALAFAAGILFGLLPAMRLSRARVGHVLARNPRAHGSLLSRRTSQALVMVEVAIAVILIAGAGLMIRSLARLGAVDLGFQPSTILTMEAIPVDPSPAAYEQFYPAVLERVRAIPGVVAAGAIDALPLSGSSTMGMIEIDGKQIGSDMRQVLPGYFEAMDLPLLGGRYFDESDRAAATAVVINEEAARSLFAGQLPVGRRIGKGGRNEIVGVVGNLRHSGPEEAVRAEIYRPVAASGTTSYSGTATGRPLTIVIRPADGIGVTALAASLRQAAQTTGQRALVRRIRSGDEWRGLWVTAPRQRTVLLGLLGGLGLLLALVGIAGVTAFAVARRTREIGVRMAFGASASRVVRAQVASAAVPIGLGLVLGLAGAAMTTRIIESFLFATTPNDPLTFAAAAGTLGVLACVAAYLPARRAARINPVEALRQE